MFRQNKQNTSVYARTLCPLLDNPEEEQEKPSFLNKPSSKVFHCKRKLRKTFQLKSSTSLSNSVVNWFGVFRSICSEKHPKSIVITSSAMKGRSTIKSSFST